MERNDRSNDSWPSKADTRASAANSATADEASSKDDDLPVSRNARQGFRRRKDYPVIQLSSDGSILNPIPTRLSNLDRIAKQKRGNSDASFGDSPMVLGLGYQMKVQDVLCFQRGSRESRIHPGNERLRVLIELHKESYQNAASRTEKTALVRKVVNIVRQSGGNFVRSEGILWFDVGDAKAREKVGHSFRAALSSRTNNNNSKHSNDPLPEKKPQTTKRLRSHSSDPQPMHQQQDDGWSLLGHGKPLPNQLPMEHTAVTQLQNPDDNHHGATRPFHQGAAPDDGLLETSPDHDDSITQFTSDKFHRRRPNNAAFAASLLPASLLAQDSSYPSYYFPPSHQDARTDRSHNSLGPNKTRKAYPSWKEMAQATLCQNQQPNGAILTDEFPLNPSSFRQVAMMSPTTMSSNEAEEEEDDDDKKLQAI